MNSFWFIMAMSAMNKNAAPIGPMQPMTANEATIVFLAYSVVAVALICALRASGAYHGESCHNQLKKMVDRYTFEAANDK